MAKLQPAVKTITLGAGTVSGGSTQIRYVDLSQIASIVNRRFYRQGINWAVAGFKVTTSGSANSGSIIALKIQETWVTSGAWEKSMRHWLKQQNDAIREMGAESTVARFRDFKVFMDTNHVNAFKAAGNDLNLCNDIPPGYSVGEWQPSQVVIPNDGAPGVTGEYYVKFYGGSDADAKDMVGGYAFSRALPTSPDPETLAVETSWLNRMQDVGNNSDEIVDNATDTNDELPYSQGSYPGFAPNADAMSIHDKNSLTTTTVGGATYLKGGMFPCGLIQFQVANSGSEAFSYDIQIDLVPGPHRGYMCQPMTEM